MASATLQVEIEIPQGLRDIQQNLGQKYPARFATALAKGLDQAALHTLSPIQRQRFTGKGPYPVNQNRLGVRTGRLRSSLRHSKAQVTNIDPPEARHTIGTNVEYLRPHEEGYQGTIRVPTHQRTSTTGTTHTVSAHNRTVDTPARAPLRTGLTDPAIQQIYTDTLIETVLEDLADLLNE